MLIGMAIYWRPNFICRRTGFIAPASSGRSCSRATGKILAALIGIIGIISLYWAAQTQV